MRTRIHTKELLTNLECQLNSVVNAVHKHTQLVKSYDTHIRSKSEYFKCSHDYCSALPTASCSKLFGIQKSRFYSLWLLKAHTIGRVLRVDPSICWVRLHNVNMVQSHLF